ncbi:unnamed protein product, partial [Citrullus colocynthis]
MSWMIPYVFLMVFARDDWKNLLRNCFFNLVQVVIDPGGWECMKIKLLFSYPMWPRDVTNKMEVLKMFVGIFARIAFELWKQVDEPRFQLKQHCREGINNAQRLLSHVWLHQLPQ